jgi:hypothetical protein
MIDPGGRALEGTAPIGLAPGVAAKRKRRLDAAAMHEARKALLSMDSIVSAMLSENRGELGDECGAMAGALIFTGGSAER